MSRRLLVLVPAVLALTVAGCGSSDDGSSSSSATPAAPASAGPAPAPAGSTVKINMQGLAFVPKVQMVKLGQTVTWTNGSGIVHNVTADSGAKFTPKTLSDGQSYSFKPTKVGTIRYECTIHPGMTATLIVVN